MKQTTLVSLLACLFLSFTAARAETLPAESASSAAAKELPRLKFNGFLRFNYNYSDWKEGSKKRGGDLGYDLFKLGVAGSWKKILLDVDFRFYAKASGAPCLNRGGSVTSSTRSDNCRSD
ncbi:MAG: hypothetical protein LUD46_16205 [Parabacteroides sp.]|nr:hypothetical protein [Parabacteroides sp.]